MPLIIALLVTLLTITSLVPARAAQPAAAPARVLSVEGTVLLERGGQRRIVGAGEALAEKDVLNVAAASHAVLEFRDQTRVTLRPNTVFRINSYADTGTDSVLLGLLKGGVRAVTGLVGKRNPGAVRVETTTATIGIRGTEFDVRLCEQDCAAEEKAKPAARAGLAVSARLVELEGQAAAAQGAGASRALVAGAALHEQETIATAPGAYAVLAFGDGSRVTLAGDTVLALEQYRYEAARPERSTAQLRLSQGGIRVLTGLIAQANPAAYRIESALGRIEARGKLLDAQCSGECAQVSAAGSAALARLKTEAALLKDQVTPRPEPAPVAGGLLVHAVDGPLVVSSGSESLEVKTTQSASLAFRGGTPGLMKATPNFTAPRPDTILIDPALFTDTAPDYQPGLYVWVREGAIALEQEVIERRSEWRVIRAATPKPQILIVTAGNAAFAGRNQLIPLPFVPSFLRLDALPLKFVPAGFTLPFFRMPDGSKAAMCTAP